MSVWPVTSPSLPRDPELGIRDETSNVSPGRSQREADTDRFLLEPDRWTLLYTCTVH